MSSSLFLLSIIFSIFVIVFLLFLLKKEKISIKYSLVWFGLFFLMLMFLLIPNFLNFVKAITGFKVESNMIFSMFLIVLVFISLTLTIIVSNQDKKIRLLIQELSILKEKINNK